MQMQIANHHHVTPANAAIYESDFEGAIKAKAFSKTPLALPKNPLVAVGTCNDNCNCNLQPCVEAATPFATLFRKAVNSPKPEPLP